MVFWVNTMFILSHSFKYGFYLIDFMKNNSQKIKIHIWISLIVLVIFSLIRFFSPRIKINYGIGHLTLGSLFLLPFGLYLIFISSMYFRNIFYTWKSNNPWRQEIIKSYLLLLLFCMFISLLALSGESQLIMNLLDSAPSELLFLFLAGYFTGLSIIVPVSIYTAFLSIKSLIVSQRENKSYSLGIYLLIFSLIFLAISFFPFFVTLSFWLNGGVSFHP